MNKMNQRIANEIHSRFYGTAKFDEQVFTKKWKNYHQDVFEHFHDRPHDLLVIDISKQVDLGPLCQFLDVPVPKKSYPHLNQSFL